MFSLKTQKISIYISAYFTDLTFQVRSLIENNIHLSFPFI
nr:MAG TPA: hypothetical protein [Caudoviricetes sp.]